MATGTLGFMDYVKSFLRFALLLVAGIGICITVMEGLAWLFGFDSATMEILRPFCMAFIASSVIVWLAPNKLKIIGMFLVGVYYVGMAVVVLMGIYCLAKEPLLSPITAMTVGASIPYVIDVLTSKVKC